MHPFARFVIDYIIPYMLYFVCSLGLFFINYYTAWRGTWQHFYSRAVKQLQHSIKPARCG